MNAIIPSGASEEDDYRQWRSAFDDNAGRGTRYIIATRDRRVLGYIAYTVRASTDDVYWNEFEIHPDHQGRGWVFRELLVRFASELRESKETFVRTYANRRNVRSQALLEKLGFRVESASERGLRYLMHKDELLQQLERRAIARSRARRSVK
jgi:ribosomal protein S18 acetylase RimI-like enzyme